MAEDSAIAWTDHTFNPWMGCTKVSPACDHCYAEALGKRTGRVQWGDDAERVPTSDAYWRNPVKWNAKAREAGRPALVFCASMADVFEDRLELDPWRARLFELIEETPHLIWLLLTKRPENVNRMTKPGIWPYGLPMNAWIGTTVEDQQRANERIPALLEIDAPVRFLSMEPLLGAVDLFDVGIGFDCLDPTDTGWETNGPEGFRPGPTVGWVIVGGESGPGHRPLNLEHAYRLREQCAMRRVPFFFKQDSGPYAGRAGRAADLVAIRQFPELAQRG